MFLSYSRFQTWVWVCYSGQSSWAMAKPLNALSPMSFQTAADVEWIESYFSSGVPSFVYLRRTGLSKLTWFTGWLSKNQPVCSAGPEILRTEKFFALHKIFAFGDWNVFRTVFRFFLFFWLKSPGITLFWNMGKMAFPPETSVVSHTIAFQDFLAKKKSRGREPSRVSVIILWYVMVKPWCGVHGEDQMRPRIVFFFAFQKIIALQGWHRILSVQGR